MAALSPDQWRALSPHLDKALGMSDEERSTWLSCLRDQDPPLADQLEALLSRHRTLDWEGFLQERSIGLPSESGLTGQTTGRLQADRADRPGWHEQRLAGGTKRRAI